MRCGRSPSVAPERSPTEPSRRPRAVEPGEWPRSTPTPTQLLRSKGWGAVGAFDATERSFVLDQLGFAAQLVFPTFAATQFAGSDLDLLYGGAAALNRAMAAFCADDPRLLAVATVPWGDPVRTAATRASCDRRRMPCCDGGHRHPQGRRVADTPRPPPAVGDARRRERSGRLAHRRRRPARAARLPRQRPHGHRLPRRRRERAGEGLHGHPPATRGVLGGDGARRHVREVPRPARGVGRGGRDVGGAVDPSTRPCDAVREDRGTVAGAHQGLRATTSTITSGSLRSPANRSAG